MTNRTHAAVLVLVLATALAGCHDATSRSPTAPQAPPRAGNGADTYHVADVILSGTIYEVTPVGRVPVVGVRVQSDHFHVFPTRDVVTDSQGFFSFKPVWVCPCSWAPWVDAGITAIWVDKDGYEAPAGQPASVFHHPLYPDARRDFQLRDVAVNGDTRFDIQLVRR